MSFWQFLASGWDWEPSVVIGCAGLLLLYAVPLRFRFSRRALCFLSGVLVLMLALVSPLDTLADTYLFSAHMLQHILLILVVPPLLILGLPSRTMEKILERPIIRNTEKYLSSPLIAWSLGVGTMWLWHWPRLYNAALASEPLHIVEHLLFLVTATIFWWPVLHPIEKLRLSPIWAVVYFFSACTAHTILAILITFAPLGIYPAYLNPSDPFKILLLLRAQWGFSPAADQQWGGLLMWVPACTVYLAFILSNVSRWYRQPERDVEPARPSVFLQPLVVSSVSSKPEDS
ncbi:MAG: cytochrome c oxidase assembly protein [Candidatus Acidiferrum sp.]